MGVALWVELGAPLSVGVALGEPLGEVLSVGRAVVPVHGLVVPPPWLVPVKPRPPVSAPKSVVLHTVRH